MILRLIPAFKKLFGWRSFAIVYSLMWVSLLIFAWFNWASLSMTLKVAVSVGLGLTTPAISDMTESQ